MRRASEEKPPRMAATASEGARKEDTGRVRLKGGVQVPSSPSQTDFAKKSVSFFKQLLVNKKLHLRKKIRRELPLGSSAFEGDLNRSSYAAEAGAQ